MSNDSRGYTQLDNYSLDILRPGLTPAEWSIFCTIYRATAGWHKLWGPITFASFRKSTGLKQDKTIRKAIEGLAGKKAIAVLRYRTEVSQYSIYSLMLEPEKQIAAQRETMEIERLARQEKRGGKK